MELSNETEAAFNELMEYLNSSLDTWQVSDEQKNIKIWRRDHNPSTTLVMRMECLFPDIPTEIAHSCLSDTRVRRKWDHRLESYDVIEKTDQYIIQRNKLMKVKIPMFSQRDQLIKQFNRKDYPEKGSHISVSKSVEHKDYPDGMENCVRTHADMIGYLFTPEPSINGTKMQWIYVNDLKGKLPGMLVQMLANKMQKKGFADMTTAMIKLKNNQLDLNDEEADIIYQIT